MVQWQKPVVSQPVEKTANFAVVVFPMAGATRKIPEVIQLLLSGDVTGRTRDALAYGFNLFLTPRMSSSVFPLCFSTVRNMTTASGVGVLYFDWSWCRAQYSIACSTTQPFEAASC